MTSHHLATYTFSQFLAPYGSAQISGFRDTEPLVFDAIDASPGLIGRSGYDGEPGPASWGDQVFPRFWVDNGDGFAPSTLSLWASLEALAAATYHGLHGQAYRRGPEWNIRPERWPGYVIWWVPKDHRPDWADGVCKLEALHDLGPRPDHFTFKDCFSPEGVDYRLDKDQLKRLVAQAALR